MDLIPIEVLSEQGLVAVLFTVVAAVASVMTEKKAKHTRRETDTHQIDLIEKAFHQMEKNLENIRCQNQDFRKDLKRLSEELKDCREKYYKQIEINNTQGAQLTKLNLELLYKKESLDK